MLLLFTLTHTGTTIYIPYFIQPWPGGHPKQHSSHLGQGWDRTCNPPVIILFYHWATSDASFPTGDVWTYVLLPRRHLRNVFRNPRVHFSQPDCDVPSLGWCEGSSECSNHIWILQNIFEYSKLFMDIPKYGPSKLPSVIC